jgi:hypothetical protein
MGRTQCLERRSASAQPPMESVLKRNRVFSVPRSTIISSNHLGLGIDKTMMDGRGWDPNGDGLPIGQRKNRSHKWKSLAISVALVPCHARSLSSSGRMNSWWRIRRRGRLEGTGAWTESVPPKPASAQTPRRIHCFVHHRKQGAQYPLVSKRAGPCQANVS